ncbi:hypothetical protein MCAP1_002160 [Malassezia caprae]|uniref:Uncharacterized protein n=1 Tax=Malassezia caprae TaxID=1381934 RepID=A0AAF0E6I1_9BASI|nr:hypothetical protein MCAP1_002160 [Malassezia caprae]
MARGSPAARRGGAASPFAKLAENTAGRRGSTGTAPGSPRAAPEARDPHDAFLLPRTLEETHHRRLRTLLHEFVAEATAWEEAHTLDGIRWASEMAQVWDDLHAVSASDDARASDEQRRARTVPLLLQWEDAHAHLTRMLARLDQHARRMEALVDAARTLVVETSAGRLGAAALQTPLWGTWTMDRFGRAMAQLSLQYSLSTVHVRGLVADLCAPSGTPAPAAGPAVASAPERSPQRAALAAFVQLPYLHTSGLSSAAPTFGADADGATGVSRHFFEHVCEAEVRSW